MFDWNAELEAAKRQVADLEEKVARFREEMQRIAEDPTQATPIERIRETNQRMLSVKMASLDRARLHARFVEGKVAAGATVAKQLPYVELAEVCFKAALDAARRGCRGGATERSRVLHQVGCAG